MESQKNRSVCHLQLAKTLCALTQKMLIAHYHEKLTELVLYELAHQNCFNFSKVAYMIDNPHFKCLHGISGFSKSDHQNHAHENIWDDHDSFHKTMDASPFHTKVRSIRECEEKTINKQEKFEELAKRLDFERPSFMTWQVKHDNYGILLFEHDNQTIANSYDSELLQGVSLLGFCPVY